MTPWVERQLLAAWTADPPPIVNSAIDSRQGEPARLDITVLDVRIGLYVYADAVDAFIIHRLEGDDPFQGRQFTEIAGEPPEGLPMDRFVQILVERYPVILQGVAELEPWEGGRVPRMPSRPPPSAAAILSTSQQLILIVIGIALVVAMVTAVQARWDPFHLWPR